MSHWQASHRTPEIGNAAALERAEIHCVKVGAAESNARQPWRYLAARCRHRFQADRVAGVELSVEARCGLTVTILEKCQQITLRRNRHHCISEDHGGPEIAVGIEGDSVNRPGPQGAWPKYFAIMK